MEFRHLQTLVAVARNGTFQKAAIELHSTQSAVSKSVRQLEDDLGVQLIERGGRKSHLTATGDVVFRHAVAILSEIRDLRSELAELSGLESGTLRLGLPALGASSIVGKTLSTFHRQYPGVKIEVLEHGSRRLSELLSAGEIEIAAFMGKLDSDFECAPIVRQPLNLIVSNNDPLAGRKTIEMRMLRQRSFILFQDGFALNTTIEETCRRCGFAPKIVTRSGQIDFIVGLVSAGVGIGFLPRNIAAQYLGRRITSLAISDKKMEWQIDLVWRRGGYLSSAARAWRSLIVSEGTRATTGFADDSTIAWRK